MEDKAASVRSTFSWNTHLSRTSVSTLSCATLTERQHQSVHSLSDVIRVVEDLKLQRYRYEDLAQEGPLGEGKTYIVEKCVVQGSVFAVKHLKVNQVAEDETARRRLKAVILEVQTMRRSFKSPCQLPVSRWLRMEHTRQKDHALHRGGIRSGRNS
ncbi:Fc.00g033140.m01.CDS01 [Cosmosporella sp. VM-42]